MKRIHLSRVLTLELEVDGKEMRYNSKKTHQISICDLKK
jgi:hypothetical protein